MGSSHDHYICAFSHEKIKAIFNLENGNDLQENFISIEKCITPKISILILIQIDFEMSKIQLFSCIILPPLNLSNQNNWFMCKRGQNTGWKKDKNDNILDNLHP